MHIVKNELKKEILFEIDQLKFPVFVRIYQTVATDHLPYWYEISHHYGTSSIYYPSNTRGNTVEEVEEHVSTYLSGISQECSFETNGRFFPIPLD